MTQCVQAADLQNPAYLPMPQPSSQSDGDAPADSTQPTTLRKAHNASVSRLALSPDRKTLASADTSGRALLWPVGTPESGYAMASSEPLPLFGHEKGISGLGFIQLYNQLCLFTASLDKSLRVRHKLSTPSTVW